MKSSLGVLAFSLMLLSSCSKEAVRGTGAVITDTRALPPFTNIVLNGSETAVINYGTASNATITGYENLLPIYETRVSGNTLYLQFRPDVYNVRNNNIRVSVTLPALAGMHMNGSGKMDARNFVNSDLNAFVNGSGVIFIGNSQYNKVNYSINGSGEIKASSTSTIDATASVTGSGNIELNATQKMKATISGSGEINYWGNPGAVETQVSGSGKIIKK